MKYNRQNIRKGATQSYRGFNLCQPVAKYIAVWVDKWSFFCFPKRKGGYIGY